MADRHAGLRAVLVDAESARMVAVYVEDVAALLADHDRLAAKLNLVSWALDGDDIDAARKALTE